MLGDSDNGLDTDFIQALQFDYDNPVYNIHLIGYHTLYNKVVLRFICSR
jgi:hypothetical protein